MAKNNDDDEDNDDLDIRQKTCIKHKIRISTYFLPWKN